MHAIDPRTEIAYSQHDDDSRDIVQLLGSGNFKRAKRIEMSIIDAATLQPIHTMSTDGVSATLRPTPGTFLDLWYSYTTTGERLPNALVGL